MTDKVVKWQRSSGSIIELRDTKAMQAFAESQGWKKKRKPKKVDHDRDSGNNNQ